MKKKISLLLCAGLLLSMLTGCSGGKLDLTWFTSKFTGKTAEDIQQEQESAAAEEAAAPEATARTAVPPSKAASLFSSTSWVGFVRRL